MIALKAILALAGPLAVLFRFKWLIALIPGVGPVLGMALGAIAAALKFVCRGLFSILTSPASICAAIFIAMVAVLSGVIWGMQIDAHLVREANSLLVERTEQRDNAQALNKRWKDKYAADELRAEEAKKAADEAEAVARAAAAKRLRTKQLAERGRVPAKDAEGPGVWKGLPPLPWQSK